MADNRKEYEVELNGLTHTVLLDAEDAERYGDNAKLVKRAKVEDRSSAASAQSK